jgi:hypothetical protein
MYFSASQLIKCSASQLLYFKSKNVKQTVTPQQLRGDAHAKQIVQKHKASDERRGIIKLDDFIIIFCIDMLKNNLAVEIKNVEGEYEDWYLKTSILQATFYFTMLLQCKTLDTPKFKIKEGYKQEITHLPKDISFELWFGNDKYQIFSDYNVFSFYKKKAEIIYNSFNPLNYDKVREFDKKYKHKEFEHLNPYYTKL